MENMFNDWASTRSFATKEKLLKALEKDGLDEEMYLIVRTGDERARWTAIFNSSHIERLCNTSVMHVIDCGFKVMG